MKILVTGGAGFIASHIADAYLADGHEVAVLDNLSSGFPHNIPDAAQFYECDIRDADKVEGIFREFQPEVVSHHAAQLDVRKSVADPVFDAQINVCGGLNILQSAVANGTRRVLFSSTGGVIYGEPDYLPVFENHPLRPESPYGLTKMIFEGYLRVWRQLHGLETVVMRYGNVYGPRQTAHGEAGVVAIFAGLLLENRPCKIFGDGNAARDYVYIGDVVEANRAALHHGAGEIFNIGTAIPTTTREVFDAVRDAVGGGPEEPEFHPHRPGEIQRICLDNSHAAELLGWTPEMNFREGVRLTVDALREK